MNDIVTGREKCVGKAPGRDRERERAGASLRCAHLSVVNTRMRV